MNKICKNCNLELPLDKFSFRKDSEKYRDDCKQCRTNKQKQYYQNNKEYFVEDARGRRAQNPELHKERNKQNYHKHKEKRQEYQHSYYKENKELFLNSQRKFHQNNPEWVKDYRQKNLEKIRKYENDLYHKKMQTDFIFRIRKAIRSRFKRALDGRYKNGSAIDALGCSIDFLLNWLEQKYYPNPETEEVMSQENYGKGWHIDHIIPLSSFDLTNPDEIKKACHYTNLQPMWAKQNIKKGNKLANS